MAKHLDYEPEELASWIDNAAKNLAIAYPDRFREEELKENAVFYFLVGRALRRGLSLNRARKRLAAREELLDEMILLVGVDAEEIRDGMVAFFLVRESDLSPPWLRDRVVAIGCWQSLVLAFALAGGLAYAIGYSAGIEWRTVWAWLREVANPLIPLHLAAAVYLFPQAWRDLRENLKASDLSSATSRAAGELRHREGFTADRMAAEVAEFGAGMGQGVMGCGSLFLAFVASYFVGVFVAAIEMVVAAESMALPLFWGFFVFGWFAANVDAKASRKLEKVDREGLLRALSRWLAARRAE